MAFACPQLSPQKSAFVQKQEPVAAQVDCESPQDRNKCECFGPCKGTVPKADQEDESDKPDHELEDWEKPEKEASPIYYWADLWSAEPSIRAGAQDAMSKGKIR